jgi:ketosteroid isomerase-like protein
MSRENVEVVSRWYELLNARDSDGCCGMLSADFELIEPSLLDAGTYRGAAGLRKWLGRIDEAWSRRRWQAEEFIDAGEYVVVRVRFVATGAYSGLEQVSPLRFQTIRVSHGRIALATGYSSLEKALAAIGQTT